MTTFEMSDRARTVLFRALTDASHRGAAVAEPEHILREIVREGEGVACRALRKLGAAPAAFGIPDPPLDASKCPPSPGPDDFDRLPTGLLATAEDEAARLGHRYIGTEHLLLALSGPRYPGVAGALGAHGVTLSAARQTIGEMLGRQLPEP